jgi:glycosyltransferase involved in cell wall biosynthesis
VSEYRLDRVQDEAVRIGVNALLLSNRASYRRTGVSRYVEGLASALPPAIPEAELIAYAAGGVDLGAGWVMRSAPPGMDRPQFRIAYERGILPLSARKDRLDIFHGTVNALPRGLSCPGIVTIHDLALLRWPDQVTSRRYEYLSRSIRDATRIATRVLAVSEATKRDIVEMLGVPEEQVTVTPLGVDARFRPPTLEALTAFRERMELTLPYILTVGTLEPRKNLVRLIRAFAALAAEIPHQLVIVGPEGWRTGELDALLVSLDLGDRLRFTGFVEDNELPCWYAASDLFVFPSLYEGFGLPILEAMACATPVVTSNVSSMPEVGGDAAVYVAPELEASIADGMRRVLGSRAEQRRLVEAGVARARQFSWARTAETTAAAYREVLV